MRDAPASTEHSQGQPARRSVVAPKFEYFSLRERPGRWIVSMLISGCALGIYGIGIAQEVLHRLPTLPSWVRILSLLLGVALPGFILQKSYQPPGPGFRWEVCRVASRLLWCFLLYALVFWGYALYAAFWLSPAAGLPIGTVLAPLSRGGNGMYEFLLAGPCAALVAFLLLPRWQRLCTRKLRQTLNYCVECDYDLTHNESGRCPECGTPIDGAPPSNRGTD